MFYKKSKLISILKKWNVMTDVDEFLLRKIQTFYGIRTFSGLNPKYGVVFYTWDDNVHVGGHNNYYNVLNLSGPQRGNPFEVDYPMKIGYNANMKKMIVTERFGVELSRNGRLSYWGMELSSEQYENPDQIILEFTSGLADETYDDFFCGGYSIVCINSEGVWIKGWLDPAPHKMENAYFYDFFRLPTKKELVVRSVSCGAYHVALLDQNNEVWTFGFGLTGQLGYHWSSGDGFENPLRVYLPRPCIKVECGAYSTLFLLDNGEVYACGRNSEHDNLCVGATGNIFVPAKVQFEDPIVDIAASYLDEWGKWTTRFGAVSRDHKKYFQWGENHPGQSPTWKADVDNLFDIFVHFQTPHSLGDLYHEEPNAPETSQSDTKVEILPASILDKWTLFEAVPNYLRPRVRAFTVFGTGSNNSLLGAFLISKEDEVYGVGMDSSLGIIGRDKDYINFYAYPYEIRALGWKKISRIVMNLVRGVALTGFGVVYYWENGQKPEILESMQDTEVLDLSAGAKFFIFLDGDGKVYFEGLMSSDYPEEDSKEIILPDGEKAVQIASGEWHGAVLTGSSDVYTFGHGIYSQLGYPWEVSDSPYTARKVQLPGRCKKIACGVCSTLFVLENGDLYACGLNKYADVLGVGHGDTVLLPEKVKIPEAVEDVAVAIRNASYGARVSSFAARTVSGKIYKWGSDTYEPKLLEGAVSLVEAFANQEIPYSLSMVRIAPPIQPQPDEEEEEDQLNEISESDYDRIKAGGIPYSDLGDPLFSDVTLKLSDGTLAVHKYFILPKSKFFREAISKAESDGARDVDLTQFNPNAIRALLKDLYGRPIEREISKIVDCLDLNDLALIDGNENLRSKAEKIVNILISYKLLNRKAEKLALISW